MNRFVMAAMFSPLGLAAVVGCKKEVDPSAFDAGVSAAPPVVVAPVGTTVAAAAATDTVAPLASLAPAGTAAPVAAGHGAPKPKPKNFFECDNARKYCNHVAVKTDKAIENLCTTNKQTCFAKGGVL